MRNLLSPEPMSLRAGVEMLCMIPSHDRHTRALGVVRLMHCDMSGASNGALSINGRTVSDPQITVVPAE